jgi:hypothetical protein
MEPSHSADAWTSVVMGHLPLEKHGRGLALENGGPAAGNRSSSQVNSEALRVLPYTEDLVGAVTEFNERIRRAGAPFLLPVRPAPDWLPKVGDRQIYEEIFVVVQDGFVRGAYTLKRQEFSFAGRLLPAAACRMPISEAIADKRYGLVGPKIIHDALRRMPLLYCLGIGSLDANISRMLRAMGWTWRVVPFFFKVLNGFRFLRNIEYLKTGLPRRLALDAAAYSGMGWLGARTVRLLLKAKTARQGLPLAEEVSEFASWTDEIWRMCRSRYSMTAVRDSEVLNILYPASDPRFIRLKICAASRAIGWAVLLDTVMSCNKYFGNMRVGSIVDCLALPEDAPQVVAAAANNLEHRGVDLLVSNQSHPAWCDGLKKAGFFVGPSNFFLLMSKQLSGLLSDLDPALSNMHLNRGDGDGPIHL